MHGQLVEKMSRQPAPKISHPVKIEPNKQEELYEEVEIQQEQLTIIRPNHVEDKSQLAGQISTETKRGKCVVIHWLLYFWSVL